MLFNAANQSFFFNRDNAHVSIEHKHKHTFSFDFFQLTNKFYLSNTYHWM